MSDSRRTELLENINSLFEELAEEGYTVEAGDVIADLTDTNALLTDIKGVLDEILVALTVDEGEPD